MKLKDELLTPDWNTKQNETGSLSNFATFTVGEYDGLMCNVKKPFDLGLVTKYSSTGNDLSTPDTWDIDVSNNIPDKPVPDDGEIAVVYYSTDSGSTWTRATISSINYYNADSNANRITIDSSGISSSDVDIKAYYLFMDGHIELHAIPTGAFGSASLRLDNVQLAKFNKVDPSAPESGFHINDNQAIKDRWKLAFKLDSSVQVSWEDDAINAFINLPVFYLSGGDMPSEEALKEQLRDKLTPIR